MTKSGSAYIECSGLFKIYKAADLEVVALRGLELTVQQGEILAIVGASGSGKSTLLNILAGYDAPSAGTIRVGDFDLLQMTNKEVVKYRRHEVGFIWQETSRNLFPYLTTLENVELPMVIAGSPKTERKKRAQELLDIVGLGDRSSHKPAELSGGEQQRVAIAVGLSNKPPLLLADEPTGELDDQTGKEVLELLNKVNQDLGTTILIVTHDPAIATSVQRAIAIKDGKTSTETTREVSYERKLNGETTNTEEFLLIDTAGSVQIPRDVLNELNIERKVKVDIKDGKVTLESGD
ncbi:MAG: ABC transporter ATP-binding protein [SAR202 cluster bacterium]|jgi:ABC-type lipoprotein export system ATPase subunit|nr:MAG: ABC transporter ATP-binding protein [SAR202 cluster bacterium]MBF06119.1 ABC transporter [Chloroflexota bacterium]MCH2529640.1 ABC transporter ATP-binding protein [Dehalococcoidia bacterium]KAA1301114.1 MAG: ABC transporter ATP-binding protein [SAR202 cluster bacterium]KAA1304966.1 MAG: ABC transporter ATP-binding protein [SAR202 cluster bacterium]|tara:strand:- start:4125 stop:5003 length:879 start_codon:yes stop_codon:yes gene_type:complete